MLEEVLWIFCGCHSMRDLEAYARRDHGMLTQPLGGC